jgi:hypothetical protein
VITCEHDHVFRGIALDDVDVLVNGVRGSGVPVRVAAALAGRKNIEAFIPFGAKEVPTVLQVTDQAVRLVLGGDADAPDAGVEGVRQREIDDPDLPPKNTAGLARLSVSSSRRLPRPPAST